MDPFIYCSIVAINKIIMRAFLLVASVFIIINDGWIEDLRTSIESDMDMLFIAFLLQQLTMYIKIKRRIKNKLKFLYYIISINFLMVVIVLLNCILTLLN